MSQGPGWGAVAVAGMQVTGLGVLYAWSVLIGPVQAHYGVDRTATGMVFSVSIAVFTLAVLTAPRLLAGWRLSAAGALACFIGAAGLACAAFAPNFVVFTVGYGGVFALASGLGYASGLQMALTSGVARPGLATGVIVAAFALGAVVLGPIIGHLGSGGALAAALILPAAILAVVAILSVGMQRYCATPSRCFPMHDAPSATSPVDQPSPGPVLTWMLWCGFATGAAGGLMVLGHAAGIVAETGGSVRLAGIAVSMISIGNALGRLTSGAIADYLGPRGVLFVAAVLLGVSTGTMALMIDSTITVVTLAFAGLSYGLMATGYPVAVHRFYSAQRFGPVYGRVFTAWGLAGLVAPFAAGWMFDRTGSYHVALLLAMIAAFMSALISLGFPRHRRQERPDLS